MRQRVLRLIVSVVALAACDGDDGADRQDGSIDEWCAVAGQIAELETSNPDLLDVDGLARNSLDEYRSLLDQAASVAPADVLADANSVADGVDRFATVAESVDFDFDQLDESELLDALDDVLALDAPIQRLGRYNERECDPAGTDLAAGEVSAGAATVPPTTTESPATTQAADLRFTGDPDSAWCTAARELGTIGEGFETVFFAAPEEIEVFMNDALARLDDAAAVAPPEIAGEVAISVGGIRALGEAFAAAGYDPLDTNLSVLDTFDAEMTAANATIDRYNSDVCGIVVADDGSAGGGFDPSAGTIRDQAIAEFVARGFTQEEAECILDKIDFSDPEVLDDTRALAAVLTECGIDFERLAELG